MGPCHTLLTLSDLAAFLIYIRISVTCRLVLCNTSFSILMFYWFPVILRDLLISFVTTAHPTSYSTLRLAQCKQIPCFHLSTHVVIRSSGFGFLFPAPILLFCAWCWTFSFYKDCDMSLHQFLALFLPMSNSSSFCSLLLCFLFFFFASLLI